VVEDELSGLAIKSPLWDNAAAQAAYGPLLGPTGSGLAPDVEDVRKLIERIRLYAGDARKWLFQR
jgi:hypothetical protein